MKRWRREENDWTAKKKRWRLGEWRRVGWWFRRERKREREKKKKRERDLCSGICRERENERKPLGFLQIWYVEREGKKAVGMRAFKYINFEFFTKLPLYLLIFFFFIPHPTFTKFFPFFFFFFNKIPRSHPVQLSQLQSNLVHPVNFGLLRPILD